MRRKQAADMPQIKREAYETQTGRPDASAKGSGIDTTDFWNNMRGVLLVLFAAGSALWPYFEYDYYAKSAASIIFTLLAPAAAFCVGYLAKKSSGSTLSGVIKYLAAYVFCGVLLFAESWLISGSVPSLLKPSGMIWFLLTAAVWRALLPLVDNLRLVLPVSLCVSILIGFWGEFDSTLALMQTVVYFPFFIAGARLARGSQKLRRIHVVPRVILGLGFLGAGIAGVWALERYVGVDADMLLRSPYDGYRVMIVRCAVTAFAAFMLCGLLLIVPRKRIPVLCGLGRGWLAAFCAVCLAAAALPVLLPAAAFSYRYYIWLGALTVLLLAVFGNKFVSGAFLRLLEKIAGMFDGSCRKTAAVLLRSATALCMVALLAVPLAQKALSVVSGSSAGAYRYTAEIFDDTLITDDDVAIAYVGDLILLQNQVYDGYNAETGLYDYSEVFRYASEYLKAADLAVGIFEGTTAGEDAGYSTSNFNDTIEMHLSYPDSFAAAVYASGIDVVTTANNHMLDKGLDGLARTKYVLEQAGLTSVGSYTDEQDKQENAVVTVQVKGLTIAFVSFTYGTNYYTAAQLHGEYAYTSNYLADPSSPYFQAAKQSAQQLIAKAVATGADCVVVTAHMGEQFSHETSTYQDVWNDIFIQSGADLVLGDHSHAVQPIEYRTVNGSTALIVNCPGNFANQYTDYDGDATALVEIYLDGQTAQIKAAAVVPMYTYRTARGQYAAVPIYTLLNDESLYSQLGAYELARIDDVHSLVTKVMLGTALETDQLQYRYYYVNGKYMRTAVQPLEYEAEQNALLDAIAAAGSVCFVGDSVTAGTASGGYGWYEPLAAMLDSEIKVETAAWGSSTVKTLLSRGDEIAAHDCGVFVIAIGVNDVRYRNENCALTAAEYAECLNKLAEKILDANAGAQIVIVSPWPSFADDPNTTLTPTQCLEMQAAYGEAAGKLCAEHGWLYLDALSELSNTISHSATDTYMIDYVHPNASAGIRLYSLAVVHAAEQQTWLVNDTYDDISDNDSPAA